MVFSSFLNTFRLSFTPNSYQEIDDFGEELIEVVSLKVCFENHAILSVCERQKR